MNLSVITVSWNSKELIGEQIRSVKAAAGGLLIEEIVVDNASTDGTAEYVRSEFPEVKVVANASNLGFSAGNNQGLEFASGEFLLFLNPDMRLLPDTLETIVTWLKQHPGVGIVSPKLVDEKGDLNMNAKPRRLPKLRDQLCIILKLSHIFPHVLDHYLMTNFDSEKEQTVESVRGSFMLMRREIVDKLGWVFDPRYFIWFEDVDTCREVKKLGYEIMYTPIISAVDYVGQSFKKRTTLWRQKQFTASMVVYFKKWEPWYVWMWIAIARPIGIVLVWLRKKLYVQ